MQELGGVLIADGSVVSRSLLERFVQRYARGVLAVGHLKDALALLESAPRLRLVIADAGLPGGGGMELVEWCAERGDDAPEVILTAAHPDPGDAERARRLGAMGVLAKPISFRDLARTVSSHQTSFSEAAPRAPALPSTKACVIDPESGEPQLVWDIHDLSASGALIETKGPLPVGTVLELSVQLDRGAVRLRAEVVRVQEPAWDQAPGLGVRFCDVDEQTRRALERYVSGVNGEPSAA